MEANAAVLSAVFFLDAAVLFAILFLVGFLFLVEKRNAMLNRRIRHYTNTRQEPRQSPLSRLVGHLHSYQRTPDWLRDRRSGWIAAGTFLATAAAVWSLTHEWWLALPIASVAASAAAYYHNAMRKRAIKKQFLNDFPKAVDDLARLVSVGVPVESALGEMGQHFPEPIRGGFEKAKNQLELGVPFGTVMRKLSADIDIPELGFFCTVLTTNREIGGSISDVLTELSRGIRERAAASRELVTLTAEARASAKVVALIPIALVGVQAVINPDGFHFLFNDPSGRTVLAYAAVSIALGLAIVKRMTRLV